jgi:hypothetical protein
MENVSPGARHAGNICCLLIEMIGVFGDSVGGENQHVKAGVVVGLKPDESTAKETVAELPGLSSTCKME